MLYGGRDSLPPIVTETRGLETVLGLFPRNIEFDGSEILGLVEPGLYSKRK